MPARRPGYPDPTEFRCRIGHPMRCPYLEADMPEFVLATSQTAMTVWAQSAAFMPGSRL